MTTVYISLGIAGYLLRILVNYLSVGSNDIRTWELFADLFQSEGYCALLAQEGFNFNHPPLMAGFSSAVKLLGVSIDTPFYTTFNWFQIAADLGIGIILYQFWLKQKGELVASRVFMLYSWSFASILISSFHGNSDTACIFFALLSIFLLQRRFYFISGTIFAMSLQVKLIPIFILPVIFFRLVETRSLAYFFSGFALAVLPFAVSYHLCGEPALLKVFGYRPETNSWGIVFIGLLLSHAEIIENFASKLQTYQDYSLILILLFLSTLYCLRRQSVWVLATLSISIFLVLTPGFGIQYLMYIVPLYYFVFPTVGFIFSICAGIFLLSVYREFLVHSFPFESIHLIGMPPLSMILSLFLWLAILSIGVFLVARGAAKSRHLPPRAKI